MRSDDLPGRTVAAIAVLIMDLILLLAAGFAIGRARDRGVLCDGASVLCSGGDPAPGQREAEMIFRSTVAYSSFAVMAAILIITAVIARRRRHNSILIMQLTALAAVAAFAVLWKPYVPLH
ncbi:hypothetical protein [Planomonospora parontospora]|uniref:hypothetical protein n=1 Tax=Planomonospora parontospora TaxID=58119 RepID=UPI0016717DBB|nr:hypothetical protein [Planomonospora parontospora]GGL21198.1 hypothetical protein GCM10014719_24060 [Planomonospora parontospora subsp. antibiotica]GII15817.1 hypothetical protein Ppa05_25430 [Planomonospora parontospora subsp. antibiotica]